MRSLWGPDAAKTPENTREEEKSKRDGESERQKELLNAAPFSLAVFSFLGFIVSSQFHRDKQSVWLSRRSVNRAKIGPDLECVLCQARGHGSRSLASLHLLCFIK